MKTIRRFSNLAEAGFTRSLLEAAGIDAALLDEHAYTLGPQYAPWGIRLQVPEADAERAERILDQQEGFSPLPDDFIPPPEPVEIASVLAKPESGLAGAFLKGGVWTLLAFAAFAWITVSSGGHAHASVGGVLLLFVIGGIVGMIVRAVYDKGRRDEAGRIA